MRLTITARGKQNTGKSLTLKALVTILEILGFREVEWRFSDKRKGSKMSPFETVKLYREDRK